MSGRCGLLKKIRSAVIRCRMNMDIAAVPFSRCGSYMSICRREQGVVVRTAHGDATQSEVFLIELLSDGKPVAFKETAGPACLRLDAKQGYARFCFTSKKALRLQAKGVTVRLTLCVPKVTCAYAAPLDEGRWQINSFTHRMSYGVSSIRGALKVDAPWEKTNARHVIVEFTAGSRGATMIEGAIEEFTSVLPVRRYKQTFEQDVRDVQREFDAWVKDSPAVPDKLAAAGELAAYVNWSSVVAAEGHFKRPAMLMSKNWMNNVWSWDHCFNAMALAYHNPNLAWDQMLLPFDHQDESGALPDCYNDRMFVRNFVKPPIHGWALRHMMKAGSAVTTKRLKEFYGPLVAWTNWWLEFRDSDHDGIPQYLHGNDSGWDNATAFDVGVPLESPDLSSFLIVQMDVLAEVARKIGKKRDAVRWTKRADQLTEGLLRHSWKGDAFVAPRSGDHAVAVGGDSLVLFMPLVLGMRLPADVRTKLIAGIAQEGRFLTKHGLATENVTSKKYEADGYWRGPIWAPSTLLIVDGLLQCGQGALAKEIASRFCNTVALSGNAENFDALTGKALRDPAYTWTSSVFQILAHELLRTGR